MVAQNGYVYLIHFARPIAHARHYLGAARDLEARIADHKKGRGARLLEVANELGVEWWVARLWQSLSGYNPFHLEKALKARNCKHIFCPICHGEHAVRRGIIEGCHKRQSKLLAESNHPLIEKINSEILGISRI